MAIQLCGDSYRILFRYQGKQQAFPIGPVSEAEAKAKSAQVDYLLLRLKQRLMELPPGVEIVDFLQHDGKPTTRVGVTKAVTKGLTLGSLRDRFIEARKGGREPSIQKTSGIHFKHLVATLGEKFPIPELAQDDLRRHLDRRAAMGISATTIKKEITTLRTA